jgi:hypothetical protein
LNSGQVGAFRAAEFIANRYAGWSVSESAVKQAAQQAAAGVLAWIIRCADAETTWQTERAEFQARMTRAGAHIRSKEELPQAVAEAWTQFRRIEESGCWYHHPQEVAEALRNRHLCFAHAVYLEAILFALRSGVGSRGSSIALARTGAKVHDKLGDEWRVELEDTSFREKVLSTVTTPAGEVKNEWVVRRPLPQTESWFETVWASFRSGEVYE